MSVSHSPAPNTTLAAHLAALIGARICHDLISPVGAIGNGLELLQMAAGADGPEMGLIADSVAAARSRILFFRIAYGVALPDQMLGGAEITGLLREIDRGGRVRIAWEVADDLPRPEARLAFLALQCCEAALPWGGTVHFARAGAAWRITATAARLRVDPGLWGNLSLEQPDTRVAPSEVQFALLPVLLAEMGRHLNARISDTDIVLQF